MNEAQDLEEARTHSDATVRSSDAGSEIDQLEHAVRARDRAMAVVAHDLRNPLNVILQTTHALARTVSDPQVLVRLERITSSARRASRLVEDLLDVTAIEQGKFSVEKGPVDVAKLVLSVIESHQALATGHSVILSMDLSPDLPRLHADPRRIHEVLENLLANAVKFTQASGHITVGASARGGEVLVWVKDTGTGIAEEHLPHVFDRFWQAQRADRRGAGLGLNICKGIVEAHGGRIWAESKIGEGTTVFFTIPATPSARREEKLRTPANILLVDDRPENLAALQAILDRPDYRFLIAGSGDNALRIALRERLSLALIDVVMPDMNGFELAAHLKSSERCRDVPILFVTAHGDDPQEIRKAYDAGCADYLVKPLDPDIVRRKVAVFVNLAARTSVA